MNQRMYEVLKAVRDRCEHILKNPEKSHDEWDRVIGWMDKRDRSSMRWKQD